MGISSRIAEGVRSMTPPNRDAYRTTRVEMYADWLAHDADGLAANLPPADPASIQQLRTARANLRAAMQIIDRAICRCELAAELQKETV